MSPEIYPNPQISPNPSNYFHIRVFGYFGKLCVWGEFPEAPTIWYLYVFFALHYQVLNNHCTLLSSCQFGERFVHSLCIYGVNLNPNIPVFFATRIHGIDRTLKSVNREMIKTKYTDQCIQCLWKEIEQNVGPCLYTWAVWYMHAH